MPELKQCQSCGEAVGASARFCAACGAEQIEQATEGSSTPAARYCSACGAGLPSDVSFCRECGARVDEVPTASAPPAAGAASGRSLQTTQPWYTQTWVAVVALVLFFPLGLFLMWRFQRWEVWIKTVVTVVGSLFVIFMIAAAAIGGEDEDGEAVRQEASPSPTVEASPSPTVEPTVAPTPEPTATPEAPATYEIADREDVSFGATVRIVYRVSVSGPLTEDDIRRIAQEIIDDETSQQDVNAIAFAFYLPGTDTTGPYSAGQAFWAPDGDWSSASTVRAGDYSGHELGAIDVGGAFREAEFTPSEETLAISEDDRRAIFKELLAAEHRADAEAEAIYPLDIFDPNWQEDNVEKNADLFWELFEKYNAEVRAKYGITEDHADEIVAEGIAKYWPRE